MAKSPVCGKWLGAGSELGEAPLLRRCAHFCRPQGRQKLSELRVTAENGGGGGGLPPGLPDLESPNIHKGARIAIVSSLAA